MQYARDQGLPSVLVRFAKTTYKPALIAAEVLPNLVDALVLEAQWLAIAAEKGLMRPFVDEMGGAGGWSETMIYDPRDHPGQSLRDVPGAKKPPPFFACTARGQTIITAPPHKGWDEAPPAQ